MLINDPLGEGSNVSSYRQRALESGELIPQNERELRRSEGSGMLIGYPLGEGLQARFRGLDGKEGALREDVSPTER